MQLLFKVNTHAKAPRCAYSVLQGNEFAIARWETSIWLTV